MIQFEKPDYLVEESVGDAELRGVPLVRPAADPPRLPRGSRPAGLRPSGRTDGARLERMRGLSESRP